MIKQEEGIKTSFNLQLKMSSKDRFRSLFLLPEKVFGRDIEMQRIKDMFQSGIQSFGCRFLFVGGPSGIGKTSFVQALFHDLTSSLNREEYSLYSGKFEQSQAEASSTFMSIIQDILDRSIISPSQNNSKIRQKWKAILAKALGKNLPFLFQLFPRLEPALVSKHSIASVSSSGSIKDLDGSLQARLLETLSTLIDSIAFGRHKILMFLDGKTSSVFVHPII